MDMEKLKEYEAFIFEDGEVDQKYEFDWCLEMLGTVTVEIDRTKSAWRMWKFVRNDQKLGQLREDYDRLKSCKTYLEGRIEELEIKPGLSIEEAYEEAKRGSSTPGPA